MTEKSFKRLRLNSVHKKLVLKKKKEFEMEVIERFSENLRQPLLLVSVFSF